MPKTDWVKKVVVLGSGAIKIGEAGEFDYSGAQAIKALKEEGIKVILINPNIATIQTDDKFADKVYFLPINPEFVEKIIEKERPDGILLGFGGQTALNCGVELAEKGTLDKYNAKVLGTGIDAIKVADDRGLFRKTMLNNDVPIPKSKKANSVEEAAQAANEIGYPVMVRVAYTLGGQGSGVAHNKEELEEIASRALVHSRIKQVLVEEYLGKWKEVEYEVMRDCKGNCIIVCNMENFDPMGIHTGDSIVIAPSQTLTNREYHILRMTSFKVIESLGIIGECNIQFAVDPHSEQFRVIEVNSRLSRSSALASKATGYPIAYIAAKLAVGYTLAELTNKVTQITTACFEPALDYVVVKIPRWDFQKFRHVDRKIGTQMKSVGEVMAVGRTFEEALQKAVRMLDIDKELTDVHDLEVAKDYIFAAEILEHELEEPTDIRIFYIVRALQLGIEVKRIHELTGIDPWFLAKIKNIVDWQKLLKENFTAENLMRAKQLGFSDKKIGSIVGMSETEIRNNRKSLGILPVIKQIDTLAAEWPAVTNYLYLTYNGYTDDIESSKKSRVIVLGSGCYRIGSSVEFDWCCVNLAWALKKKGIEEVIMINYNPETVSTDYDVLDKLYFEELSLERVLDIIEKEKPNGVVVSVGGQIPNSLAVKLANQAVRILGTAAENIDKAEDRSKFSAILDELDIKQPEWSKLETIERAKEFADKIGYPVIVRPSYVLSGSAMNVAFDDEQLEDYLNKAAKVGKKYPVVISKFMLNAREVEVDGICDGENVFVGAIIEHVENAGVHSGDATMCIPSINIQNDSKQKIRDYTRRIVRRLNIQGPFNIQYIIKDGEVYVIECNLRASRSMPFVSKTTGINLMNIAANAMLEGRIEDGEASVDKFSVKVPQFSFMRLEGADPITGVEMVSTGEVACFGESFEEAFLKALMASGQNIPERGDSILITVGGSKECIIAIARKFWAQRFQIYATMHTAEALTSNGIKCEILHKVSEKKQPNILDYLTDQRIKLVISVLKLEGADPLRALDDSYVIRRKAVEFGIPVITNLELADALINAIDKVESRCPESCALSD
ncbi:MAG: carbamoyl-phosphate synthase (glutamine-hydrolyzing) large subunit [Candidatus Bathyarchaeota archaeon]|nr:carbamoyl-phosphate synthase (glutamine-hydrolyzing) large subunit [Candidatus Bathyarchaeota archaeon]MDH5787244.1 carbamoyl-phosphate synthase (glutamine-hydrolyzing) large subunit [Candidatus Bathyarchaeota archaeon]